MIMKCGHAPNSNRGNPPVPACVICDCVEPADETPNLADRAARCIYCKKETPSDLSLAFFRSGSDYDTYYCGCKGWD